MLTQEDIDEIIKATQEEVNKYTYPIFVISNDKPDLIASSVIIEIEKKYYLITASHVIEEVTSVNTPFSIAIKNNFLKITDIFTCADKNFDIAYVELNSKFISKNNIISLKPNRLIPKEVDLAGNNIAFIHGFPNSKNKQKKALFNQKSFRVKAYAYAGIIKNDFSNWDKYDKLKENHTCMSYGKTSNNNTPTNPKGISGGGLWIVPDISNPKNYYLESIAIEYYKRDSIVIATKILKVISFIEETSKHSTKKDVILPSN